MPNYESNGVIFRNVKAGLNTGGQKINVSPYRYENGNIKNPQLIINAIDIDWCNAQVPGLENDVESTAALLAKIGSMNETISALNNALTNTASSNDLTLAVEQINSAIEELSNNLGSNETITNLSNDVEGLSSAVDDISGTLENLSTEISQLRENAGNNEEINTIKEQIRQILNGTLKPEGQINHVILTEEEYEALEYKDQNTVYFITEEDSSIEDEEDPLSTALYVNGTLVTDANVVLAPGYTYTLEGNVVGTITIDASNINDPSNLENTELRLKGVKVISTNNYGIRYLTPEENKGYKDLVITLEKNTKNYVVCTEELEAGNDQPGAVYSMNNLTIQGPGYLAVHNAGGHGIRGTEVKLLNSHIYADVIHDAIHAKKMWICGGTYYINSANDAFGTGIGGSIKYAYGDIYINELLGKIFNAKSGEVDGTQLTGTVIKVEDPHIISLRGATYTSTEITPIISLYNSCTVKEYDTIEAAKQFSLSGTVVNDSTGMYIVTKPFITVEGLVEKPINIPSNITDVTIFLCDAIINTNQVSSGNILVNEPSIAYDATTSNIKIQTIKDTYNVIINNCPDWVDGQDADAVKSEHNIKVEIKNDSYLYISAKSGDGLDGTDVNITDSKGILMIHKCGERAIKGNNIIIGPSASTPAGSIVLITDTTSADYTTFDGAILATENCVLYGPQVIRVQASKIAPGSGYADIFARKGKAMDKGSFIITAQELKGIVVCNTLGATIAINTDNSANLYYNELMVLDQVTQTGVPAATVEQYLAYPYKKTPISK